MGIRRDEDRLRRGGRRSLRWRFAAYTIVLLLPVLNVAGAAVYFRSRLVHHLDTAIGQLRGGADREVVTAGLIAAHGGLGDGLLAVLGSAGVSLVLSVVVSRRLSRLVLAPLARLRAAAQHLGDGGEERLRWGRRDELGVLADSLDGMADGLQATHDRLRRQALHDPLTGLGNRTLLRERLNDALRSGATGVSLLLLDLDGFKRVNDALGHAVGDDLLVALAQRLRAVLTPRDTLVRLGGDEFAVLVLDSPTGGRPALHAAKELVAALREPVRVGERLLPVNASIGVAHDEARTAAGRASSGGGEEARAEQLLRHADLAMYAAKGAGGNRFAAYTPDLHEALLARLRLEEELRTALTAGQIVVHHQPVVRLADGAVVGVEALVRWQHPLRGLLAPCAFLPVAEATGLIVPLGWLVLREACARAAAWRRSAAVDPLFYTSVNLSAGQLEATDLVDQVRDALSAARLPAACLVLEMTETVLMDDAPTTLTRLDALRQLGVRLAIDDFGTGYSSFGYLQRFPVDVLKLDKVFVDPLVRPDAEALALVRAMTALAAVLGLQTVAEGVEHEEQAERLRDAGVHLAQGYLLGRPVPADEVSFAARVPVLA